jgi:hypothetical protein
MSDTKLRATQLQAYFVLFSSLLYSVTFVVIEIANAAMTLWKGQHYVPSNESIVVLGLLLSHHLGILFSKPSAYKAAPAVVLASKTVEATTFTTPEGQTSSATSTAVTTSVSVDTPAGPPAKGTVVEATDEEYAEAV